MELMVKFLDTAEVRLGIKYPYEHSAQRSYEQVIEDGSENTFELKLEIHGDKLDLTLHSDYSGKKYEYGFLDFKKTELLNLYQRHQKSKSIYFLHVFPRANSLYVAKPFRKKIFMKISSLAFRGFNDLD